MKPLLSPDLPQRIASFRSQNTSLYRHEVGKEGMVTHGRGVEMGEEELVVLWLCVGLSNWQ